MQISKAFIFSAIVLGSPIITRVFWREVCPALMEIVDFGRFRDLANRVTSALLAFPLSGIAVTRARKTYMSLSRSSAPSIRLCDAFGVRRT